LRWGLARQEILRGKRLRNPKRGGKRYHHKDGPWVPPKCPHQEKIKRKISEEQKGLHNARVLFRITKGKIEQLLHDGRNNEVGKKNIKGWEGKTRAKGPNAVPPSRK